MTSVSSPAQTIPHAAARDRTAQARGPSRRAPPWTLALILGLAVALIGALTSSGAEFIALGTATLLLIFACAASRYAVLMLLALLLAGHVAFTADFAKISVSLGVVPLYVTEFLIVPMLLGSGLSGRWRVHRTFPLLATVGMLTSVGLWLVAKGVLEDRDAALVLRQSALFLYPLMALVCAWNVDLARDRDWIIRVALAVSALALITTAFQVVTGEPVGITTETGVPRFFRGDSGAFFAAVFVYIILTPGAWTFRSQLMLAIATVAVAVGVLLAEHRSVWLGTGGGLVAGALLGGLSAKSTARTALFVFVLGIAAIIGSLFFNLSPLVGGTLDRLGETTDTENVNAAWRLAAWDTALRDIADKPLTGVGLGQPLAIVFNGQLTNVEPHNSLIDIAWHVGLLGFVIFGLSQLAFLARVLGRRSELHAAQWSAPALVGVWVSLLIAAAFNVILELPIGGTIFWVMVGLPFGRLASDETASQPFS